MRAENVEMDAIDRDGGEYVRDEFEIGSGYWTRHDDVLSRVLIRRC